MKILLKFVFWLTVHRRIQFEESYCKYYSYTFRYFLKSKNWFVTLLHNVVILSNAQKRTVIAFQIWCLVKGHRQTSDQIHTSMQQPFPWRHAYQTQSASNTISRRKFIMREYFKFLMCKYVCNVMKRQTVQWVTRECSCDTTYVRFLITSGVLIIWSRFFLLTPESSHSLSMGCAHIGILLNRPGTTPSSPRSFQSCKILRLSTGLANSSRLRSLGER